MKKVIIPTLFAFLFVLVGAGTIAAQSTSVAGEWDGVFNTPGGPRPFKLILKVDGEKLAGTAKRQSGDVAITGTIKGDAITFSYTIEYNGNAVTLTYTGKVKGDTMGGSVSFNDQAGDEWSAKRAPAEKPKTN